MYDQKPSTVSPPQFDDFDEFMSKRKTATPKAPKAAPAEDFDDFMSKRATPTTSTSFSKAASKGYDVSKYPTPVSVPSIAGNPNAKQSPIGYIGEPSVNDPNSPVGGPMSWTGTKVDSQGRPGRGMVRHEAPAPTGQFKLPVSMDFRAPTDVEQMVNRSQVATGKVAPAPTTGATGRSAFQQIKPRRSALDQYQDEQAAQRGSIANSVQFAEPQVVTPEERRTAAEKFYAQNELDKAARQAEAKARVEAEAARAPKDAFSKIGGHFVRGAVKGVTAPLSMAAATDKTTLGRQAFSDAVQGAEDTAAEYFPVDRTNPATLNVFKPEFYSLSNIGRAATENVPETIGQMLPAIALSRGAGAAAGLAAPELAGATALPRLMPAVTGAELASRTAAGAYGAMNQAQQAYQNAIAAGFSHDEALRAAAMEAPIGASEFLGSPGTTGAVRPRTVIGREMKEEGLQELGQNVAGDLMAKYGSGYGANKSLADIAGEGFGSGALGAAVGGLGALPGAAREGRMVRAENNAVRAESAPMQGIRPTTLGPTQITPLTRATAAAEPATTTPAIEPTVTTPITPEPSANPPVAAEPQSSALFPDAAPIVKGGVPDRSAFPPGDMGDLAHLLASRNAAKKPSASKDSPELAMNKAFENANALIEKGDNVSRKRGVRSLKQMLNSVIDSSQYAAELDLPDDAPKPYTAARAAIEERLKPAPKQVEPEPVAPDAANSPTAELPTPQPANTGQRLIEQTRQKADAAIEEGRYGDAILELKAHQQALKDAKTAARKSPGLRVQLERQIGQVGNRIGEVRKMDREARKQANAPTKPATFPQAKAPQVQSTQPITGDKNADISAPLLRPEAVQNPEGGIPQMPEQTFSGRLDQGIRKDAAEQAKPQRVKADTDLSPIEYLKRKTGRQGFRISDKGEAQRLGSKEAGIVGLTNKNSKWSTDDVRVMLDEHGGFRMPDGRAFTDPTVTENDVLTYLDDFGKQQPMNTGNLEQRLKDKEAAHWAQQEEAASEPAKSFDQIDEEVQAEFNPNEELDARTLQEVRNFGKKPKAIPVKYEPPARPQIVGNRPMTIDVAGTRTPSAMSAEFPRARRAMVRAGREVEARLEMGQEKGGYGNYANAMFKSNSPDVLHGQDSFFHDPDVKGKLGLTRDAEMGDVRKELKTQLARSLGVTVDEVSLSHIKPEVWRAWARQKGLGKTAMRKLEAGINRAEGKERAIKTNAQTVAEESQRAKEELRQPEGKAAESESKSAVKEPWQMSPDEYAWSVGAEKPDGFALDASPFQLSQMNSRERNARSRERSRKQSVYNDAVKQWEDKIWAAYKEGKFSASDVFDTDAFYVLSSRLNSVGVDMASPFRITKMDEAARAAYLEGIDAKIQQATAKASEPAPIKTGDSVTWQSGGKTFSGAVTKVNGDFITATPKAGEPVTRHKSKFTAADENLASVPSRNQDSAPESNYWNTPRVENAPVTDEDGQRIVADSRVEFRRSRRGAGTLWTNNQASIVIASAANQTGADLGAVGGFAGISMSHRTTTMTADLLREKADDYGADGKRLTEIANALEAAQQDAIANGRDDIVIADSTSADNLSEAKRLLREERFHSWQRGAGLFDKSVARALDATLGRNPIYRRIKEALLEEGYSDSPRVLSTEAAAKAASGQWERYGLKSEDEALEFLNDYYKASARMLGVDALMENAPATPQARRIQENARKEEQARLSSRVQSNEAARGRSEQGNADAPSVGGRIQGRRDRGSQEANASSASKGKRASFGELENEPTGQVLGVGLGGLQKMLGRKVETPPAVPKDWDVDDFIGKISKQILPQTAKDGAVKPAAIKLTDGQAKDVMSGIRRMIAGANNEDFTEIFKAREDVRKAMFPELKRDVKWFDHLQSRLSNANFRGTYERIAGKEGKEISEIFRNAQVDTANDKITRGQAVIRLRKELRPYIQRLKMGGKPGLASWVETHIDAISDPDQSFRGLAGFLKGLNFYTLLAYNPRSAFVNKLQPLQTLWPHVTSRDYMKLLAQARNPEIRKRVLEAAKKESGGNTERPEDKKQIWTLFSRVSDSNRVLGHLAGEMFADRQGLTGDAKARMAADWAKKVEFDTSQYDVPPLFAKPLASVLGQFKSFQIKNLERIYADWKSAAPETLASGAGPNAGKIARRAKMIAGQVAIGGVRSAVPGLKHIGGVLLLGALAKGLSNYFDDDKAEKIAEVVYFGLPGLIDQDLSGSVMLFDEPFGKTPYEQAVNFFLGPSVSRAMALYDEGKDYYNAEDSKETTKEEKRERSALKIAKTITPLTKTGQVLYAASQGKTPNMWLGKEVPMNIKEAIGFGLMGTPLRQTKFYDHKEAADWQKKLMPNRFPADDAKSKKTRVTETGDIESTIPKKKLNEPDEIYQQRADRVSSWMDYYGGMLLNDPRYQSLPPDMQEAAIENLRKRIGRQQNIAQPKIDRRTGQIESFTPGKVLEGVNKSVRERPKKDAKKLWVAPPR